MVTINIFIYYIMLYHNNIVEGGSQINNKGNNDNIDEYEYQVDKFKKHQEDIENAVTNYYYMKCKYETNKNKIREKKIEIMKKKGYSNNKIKKKLDDLSYPCVNCNRNVNSIFMYKNEKIIARCGTQTSPCNLNISILKDQHIPYERLLHGDGQGQGIMTRIDKLKNDIIRMKLDMIFEFTDIDKTIQMFKQTKKNLEILYSNLDDIKLGFLNISDKYDLYDIEKLEDNRDQIIDSIKRTIQLFETTDENTKQQLKQENIFKVVADKYVNELGNLISNINSFKYNIYIVEPSNKNNYEFIKRNYIYVDTIQNRIIKSKIESNIYRKGE
tara:strand:- start:3997 stop:4980 length:984 start_codon:yes stop_codon:yes gene_type:complete